MPWIIDTDPGVDDAAAMILTLNLGLPCRALTIVYGNVELEKTLLNALRLREVMGHDIPVVKGVSAPLLQPMHHASEYHGQDGFGDLPSWPPLQRKEEEGHAVDTILECSREKGELSLLTLGPLTNVALAMARDRNLGRRLGEVIIMGGTMRGEGNITCVSEFNLFADPEAAAIVMGSGARITLVPWELALDTPLYHEELADLKETELGSLFFAMAGPSRRLLKARGFEGFILPDLLAGAVALNPQVILEKEEVFVDVELAGKYSRGQLILDTMGLEQKETNAVLCRALDRETILHMFRQALKGTPVS